MQFTPNQGSGSGPTIAYGIDLAGLNTANHAAAFTCTFACYTGPGGYKVDGSGNIFGTSLTATAAIAGTGITGTSFTGPSLTSGTATVTIAATGISTQTIQLGETSAHNSVAIQSVPTGNTAVIQENGVDANTNFKISAAGTGFVALGNPNGTAVQARAGSGVVDAWSFTGSASANPGVLQLAPNGTDTNISELMSTKGTGQFIFRPGTDGSFFLVQNAAGSSNYFTVNTSTGAVTMPALGTSSAGTTGTVCWTTGTGLLNVDTTTTCLLSDGRHKMNVEPLLSFRGEGKSIMPEIMEFRPVSYDLKPEANPTHLGRQVGLIAQDVIKVDPRLASVYQSGPDAGTPSGVRYEQMVALLVKGMQEQQHEIDDLKRQIKRRHH